LNYTRELTLFHFGYGGPTPTIKGSGDVSASALKQTALNAPGFLASSPLKQQTQATPAIFNFPHPKTLPTFTQKPPFGCLYPG
jgi:hypothetical protein